MIVNWPLWLRTWFWLPTASVLAFAPLLLSQALQLASTLVWPFSKPLFRRINTSLAAGIWGFWAKGLQGIVGTKVEWDRSSIPYREDAIVIANHQSMADIVILLCPALAKGSIGHLKWMVKDIIKYIPGIGWGMLFLDCVYLKRDWARDRSTIKRVFSRLADNRLPVWLVSFPEGTRATPEKRALARARAAEKNQEYNFKHLLPPRPKGFVASVFGLRDHIAAVYSLTIIYEGKVPTLLGLMRGDCKFVKISIERTPIELIPAEEDAISRWLVNDFGKKDAFMAQICPAQL